VVAILAVMAPVWAMVRPVPRPAGMLFTGASVIAAINSMVGGVGVALLAVGIAAAVVLSGLHLLYQQQRAAFLVLRPPAQASSA
jgi:hypothetical protein